MQFAFHSISTAVPAFGTLVTSPAVRSYLSRFKRTLLSANTFTEKIDTDQIHSHVSVAGNGLRCYEKLYLLFESL